MGDSKGVATPRANPTSEVSAHDIRSRRVSPKVLLDPDKEWPGSDTSDKLGEEAASRYRSVAALLNFSALDRPELLYCIKELMRKMAAPTVDDESALKRAIRFVKTLPRPVATFRW